MHGGGKVREEREREGREGGKRECYKGEKGRDVILKWVTEGGTRKEDVIVEREVEE